MAQHSAYNQWRAMFAIAKGSFRAILRSPSAVVFSLGFPLIFILVFGFIGGGGPSIRVAMSPTSDTANWVYTALRKFGNVDLVTGETQDKILSDVRKGRITAIIDITRNPADSAYPRYTIHTTTSSACMDKFPLLETVLKTLNAEIDQRAFPGRQTFSTLAKPVVLPGREYRMIDFILPGMLGFSLLSAGIFGVAFLFFNLRQTLVLKRFFATPIRRTYIVLGEGLSRVCFQLITAVVIIGIGHAAFHFTLIHGWETFLNMLCLSFIGLVVFMGFGFIVSSVAKNESSIPPFANLVTMPQFLLGGTFFSTDAFPGWLRTFCNALPLKQLNDALRDVAFEGAHLWDVKGQIGYLLAWGVLVYAIAIKVFKWE
jgi:ABC-2 type transport system permease protein